MWSRVWMWLLLDGVYVVPFLLALLVALLRRRHTSLDQVHRVPLIIASTLGICVMLSLPVLSRIALRSRWRLEWLDMWKWNYITFSLPLIAALLAMVLMLVLLRYPKHTGVAALERRSTFMYCRKGMLVAIAVCAVVAVGLALATGLPSMPDDDGHFTRIMWDAGSLQFGTSIYGWHYSVPALCELGLLLLAAFLVVRRIALAPVASGETHAAAHRITTTGILLTVVLGALSLHLSQVLFSLHGLASAGASMPGIQSWSPVAAMQGTFAVLAGGMQFVGVFCFAYAFWRTMLSRKPHTQVSVVE